MALLWWKDGKPREVPDDKIDQAFADGFREPTEEEAARYYAGNATGQTAKAFAEGTFRGLTFGLSDQALATDKTQAREMRLRKEENTGAALGGELLGSAALPFPGSSAASWKLRALRAAGEGGLFGLGHAVSEAALGNTPLTAEKLAAGGLGGALFGGALSSTFSGLRAATAFGASKVGTALPPLMQKAADKIIQSELGGEIPQQLVDYGRRMGVLGRSTTFRSGFETASKLADDANLLVNQELAALQQQAPAGVFVPQIKQALDRVLSPLKSDVASGARARNVDKVLQELLDSGPSWQEVWNQRARLAQLSQGSRKPALKEVYDRAVQAIDDVMDSNAPRSFAEAAADYKSATALRDLFAKRLLERRTGRFSDAAAPAAAGFLAGGPLGGALAMGGALFGKQIKERVGFAAAGVLDDLLRSPSIRGSVSALKTQIDDILLRAPQLLGPFRAQLEQASAGGVMSLLETHVQIASSASGDEYLSALGLEREDAATTQGYSTKIQYLDSLSESIKQFDVALDKAVAGRGSAPRATPLTQKEFGKLASRLNELSADPTPLFEAVPSDLGAVAPSLMNQAAATAARAAQYLAQVMPKPPSGSPLAPKWQPSAAQLSEFSARLNAVQDPRKALEGAVLGGSKASLDAVRSVYPSLYADFEQRLIERVMTEGSKMSYSEKLRLAPILGAQVLGLSNQQMMVVQQTHAMLQGKPSVQRPDGRQRVDTEQNLETQAQRLEGR